MSKNDQTLSLQIDALKKAECDEIFSDEISGSSSNKPGLSKLFSKLRSGDSIVVWKLDRLGRSVKNLIEITGDLASRGINFQSITEGINTNTPAGLFFFHIMASLAQMERDLIVERTKAGLEAAKLRGRVGGRKRKMTESKKIAAMKLLAQGVPPKDIAFDLGISIPTLYRWLPASDRQ